MRVFALAPNEDWICDRFVDEWNTHSQLSCLDPRQADAIWLLSDWAWRQLPIELLRSRPVVTTVHHVVPSKFGDHEVADFIARDAVTDLYHVPCEKTRDQISPLTKKPIFVQPFWVNGEIWSRSQQSREEIRRTYGMNHHGFFVGSFQRDTEGHDLVSPKLEKGPDLFCDAVEQMKADGLDPFVVLGGWRRQYVIGRLLKASIPYAYFERPPLSVVRDLYCSLDLYVVAARYEGGPQSIVECAALEVPIVSTDVGVAKRVLAPESIGSELNKLRPNVGIARARVEELLLPQGIEQFNKLFSRLDSVRTVR